MSIKSVKVTPARFSVFDYGFRPFFLAAGIYAVIPLIPWALAWMSWSNTTIAMQAWHAHEMIFGFAFATIAGFLLTAIPNWTGQTRVHGTPLKLIFALWLICRILFWIVLWSDHRALSALLFIDALFPLTITAYAARAIFKSGNTRNMILVALLLAFAMADIIMIADINYIKLGINVNPYVLCANLFFVLLAVIGGRVTANFTRGYLSKQTPPYTVKPFGLIDILSLGSVVFMLIIELIWPTGNTASFAALIAAGFNFVRFTRWHSLKTLRAPIMWVLHLGYIWLIIALLMKGLVPFFTALPPHLYIHALTMGAVGTYILGVMSRAALGHTGRPLTVSRPIAFSYLLISIASLIRLAAVFTPHFLAMILIAMTVWAAGYTIFVVQYYPILTRPRIDGRPG